MQNVREQMLKPTRTRREMNKQIWTKKKDAKKKKTIAE